MRRTGHRTPRPGPEAASLDRVTEPSPIRPPLPAVAALLVAASLVAYAPTLAAGYAGDDEFIVAANPIVTEGRIGEALLAPYWPESYAAGTLYRPLTVVSLALEYRVGGGHPGLSHGINLGLHAGASLLLFLLLLALGLARGPALAAALVFAVHPVHAEAVAPVVGRSELLAAVPFLAAVWWWTRSDEPGSVAVVGIPLLYLAALGGKEIAITLPAVLVLTDVFRGRVSATPRRLATWVGMAGAALVYGVFRIRATGGMVGESPAAEFWGLSPLQRIGTALSAWTDYLRLMVWPRVLSADYSPAVRFPAVELDGPAILGTLVFLAWVGGVVLAWHRERRTVALGLAWFGLVLLPVSNFLIPTGVLLAERVLYLPSVGLAIALAVLCGTVAARVPRPAALGVLVVALVALAVRTHVRSRDWMDTNTLMAALERDHPTSVVVVRGQARDAMAEARWEDAARAFDLALQLSPHHYGALTEAGLFWGVVGEWERARRVLEHAILVQPSVPHAYRILARQQLRASRPEDARRTIERARAATGDPAALAELLSE